MYGRSTDSQHLRLSPLRLLSSVLYEEDPLPLIAVVCYLETFDVARPTCWSRCMFSGILSSRTASYRQSTQHLFLSKSIDIGLPNFSSSSTRAFLPYGKADPKLLRTLHASNGIEILVQ